MDNTIFPYPLTECADEVASQLMADGVAKHCSSCAKPFTTARKPKSVIRNTHISPDIEINAYSFLLCRKCNREAKQPGNTTHQNLFNQAVRSAALFEAKPKCTS